MKVLLAPHRKILMLLRGPKKGNHIPFKGSRRVGGSLKKGNLA